MFESRLSTHSSGPIHILAISGSLRAASWNSTLVRALALLAPPALDVSVYGGLGDVPPFNPDDDVEPAPAAVADFRSRLRAVDAVVISTPEYAHGIPGTLKNALDWVVDSGIAGDPALSGVLVSALERLAVAAHQARESRLHQD
jgi:NAD(P)H-dependent FMN reductase